MHEKYRPIVFSECRGKQSGEFENFNIIYGFFEKMNYCMYPKDKISGDFRHSDILFLPDKSEDEKDFIKKTKGYPDMKSILEQLNGYTNLEFRGLLLTRSGKTHLE